MRGLLKKGSGRDTKLDCRWRTFELNRVQYLYHRCELTAFFEGPNTVKGYDTLVIPEEFL